MAKKYIWSAHRKLLNEEIGELNLLLEIIRNLTSQIYEVIIINFNFSYLNLKLIIVRLWDPLIYFKIQWVVTHLIHT